MRTNQLFPLVMLLILPACEKTDKVDDNQLSVLSTLKGSSGITYNESLQNWNDLKKRNGNSYIYQVTFVSWIGVGSTTVLKVENGIVTSRSYEQFKTNAPYGPKEITDTYTETGSQVGSHTKGAVSLTIDDLYTSCAKEYLKADKEQNTLFFETEENGLMNLCGFVPNGCMDDCYHGVRISGFEWIK